MRRYLFLLSWMAVSMSCSPKFDIVILNGNVVDGTGNSSYKADIAVKRDTIAIIGDLGKYRTKKSIDATGKIVAPGFINMLSWAPWTLLNDGRSLSDLKQGVTLEVFGEGESMGPLSPKMKTESTHWTTLGEYFSYAEEKGISVNIASFVGATTIREHVLEYENRAPNGVELEEMKNLVRQAMEEGALGLGSSLIYPPAFFASTEELIELNKVVAEYGGVYISHMRSEGNKLLEAIDEMITITKESGVDGEIYHLKAAGLENWNKLDRAIQKIDSAREAGIVVGADMYLYTAGSTDLKACLPPWLEEGGEEALLERLRDPLLRDSIINLIRTPSDEWENFYVLTGSPENIQLLGFSEDSLKRYTGKTLKEIAELRGTDYPETIIDLLVDNGGGIGSVYFLMSEENVIKQIQLPYMSFCSDAGSYSTEGGDVIFTHPRAYGNFARLLGKYIRDEKVITLEEGIHKLTGLSADKLHISNRGRLLAGNYADLVILDLENIQDIATYQSPQIYSSGVEFVIVNGVLVLEDGIHTGKMPGRAVRRSVD